MDVFGHNYLQYGRRMRMMRGASYDQGYGSMAIESRSGEYFDIENGDVNAPSEGPILMGPNQ